MLPYCLGEESLVMQDLNWKTWGLIFVLAIGLAFEGIKRLPADKTQWDADNLKFPSAAIKPYQVKYKKNPPDILPMHQPAGRPAAVKAGGHTVSRETIEKFIAANSTQKNEFGHVDKGTEGKDAKAKKKKKGDDDEYEIIVDPKTGKRYRRKKKKIVKIEEPKVEVAKEEPKKEEPKSSDDEIEGLMNEAITNGSLPPTNDKADTPFADLEEWKKRLLTRPDPKETRRFIEHYKNDLVTADIFYKIVSMMIEDSRPQMKELGVLCAGLTPSVMSFQVLADVIKAERSGSSLRTYTQSFIARYSDLNNLHILERILKSPSSSFVAVMATKSLDASVTRYLSPAMNKPPKNATTQTTGHSNSGFFMRFVNILNALVRNPDSSVSTQARTTLANLNNLRTLNAPDTLAPGTPPPSQASTQP